MKRFISVLVAFWWLIASNAASAQTIVNLGGIANDGGAFANFGINDGSNNEKVSQRFSGITGIVVQVKVSLVKVGSPTDNVVVSVRQGNPDGPMLGSSATVAGSSLSASVGSDHILTVGPFAIRSDISYFVVYSRSGASDPRNFFKVVRGTNGSVFGAVTSGEGHFFRTGVGWVSISLSNSFMLTVLGYAAPAPPVAPTGLTAAPAGNQVSLLWNTNAEPTLVYYKVYRNATSGFVPTSSDSIGRVNKPTVSFTDTGLTVGTYYYRVAAVDSFSASSPPSAQVSAVVSSPIAPPVIGVAPSPLAMDSTLVGSSSQKILTISNTGGANLSVTGIAVGGADALQFSVAPSSVVIVPGSSQNVTVTFSPTSTGSKSALLTLTHNAAGGSTAVSINGAGKSIVPTPPPASPTATVNPTVIALDTTNVGSFSQKTFVVQNSGSSGNLTVSNIVRSGADSTQFAVSPTAFTVGPGGSQTVTVNFVPSSAGSKATILGIYHNANGSPSLAVATGMGRIPASPPPSTAPAVSLPDSLVMDSTAVGSSSQKIVTASNTGTASLAITAIAVSGTDAGVFSVSPTNAAVAAGTGQGLTVRFTPTSIGAKLARLIISHNAAGSPDTIKVTGFGKAPLPTPSFSASPVSLALDSVLIGSTGQKICTVSNAGAVGLVVSSAVFSGLHASRFSVLPTSANIAAGSSQIFIVTFAPDSAGTKSASLVFSHNAAGGRDSVSVTGIGKAPPPVPLFGVGQTTLVMDTTNVGSISQKILTVTNSGIVALNVSSVIVSGTHAPRFSVLPTSANIAAGSSQIFIVTFAPDSAGTKSASLVFSHNAAGTPHTVNLSGVGRSTTPPPPVPTPSISVSPVVLTMDSTLVGSFSQKTVSVSNTGTANLVVSNITRSGADSTQFAVSPTAFTVSPSGSQTVTVTFVPSTAAQKSTILNITHNAVGSPMQIVVSGMGKSTTPPPANNPAIAVVTSLALDSTNISSTSQKLLAIFNTGTANLVIFGITVSGAQAGMFAVSPTTTTITPGSSQSVTVSFTPTSAGAKSAILTIGHNANGGSTVVGVSGFGKTIPTQPAPGISMPTSLVVDITDVGSFSQKTLVVSNTGTANLVVSNITRSGADSAMFSVSPASFTVSPNGLQTVTVNFAPVSSGNKAAALTISHNAGNSITVNMTGVGRAAIASSPPVQNPPSFSGPVTVDFSASNTEGRGTLDTKFDVRISPSNVPFRRIWIITGAGDTLRSSYTSYTYTRPGKYTVRVEVLTEAGQLTVVEKPNYITVLDVPPSVDFTASPVKGEAPL
ncbi:MAG: choice-of-anchor D domain-containing protein, partial [Patescibacteria group bacterium]